MVASGLGISIVPFQSVAREIRGGTLRVARIEGQTLVRETGWVHLRADRVPRMVQEMMDTLTHPAAPAARAAGQSGRTAKPADPDNKNVGRRVQVDVRKLADLRCCHV